MEALHLLAAALIVVGLLLGIWGGRHYRHHGARHADARARWIRTTATVLDSRIVERERTDSNDNSYTVYEPRIRYGYTVDGQDLESEQLALCPPLSFASARQAEAWLSMHDVGSRIDMWYDPAQPLDSACALNKPSLLAAIATVLVGCGLVAAGSLALSAPL